MRSSTGELKLKCKSRTNHGREAMTISTMSELFVHGLQDVYYAENQIAKAAQEIMTQVTEPAMFDLLEHHVEEAREQIARLEQIFKRLGRTPQGVTCQAVLGLIEEGQELQRTINNKQVLDTAILASMQAIEHYEINRYGTLIAWASELKRQGAQNTPSGEVDIVDLLQLSLDEERGQDARLTALADSKVNRHATRG